MKKLIALGFSLFIATGLCAQTSSITILTPDAISNLVTRVVKAGANVTISTNTNTFVLTITATGGGGGGNTFNTTQFETNSSLVQVKSGFSVTNMNAAGTTTMSISTNTGAAGFGSGMIVTGATTNTGSIGASTGFFGQGLTLDISAHTGDIQMWSSLDNSWYQFFYFGSLGTNDGAHFVYNPNHGGFGNGSEFGLTAQSFAIVNPAGTPGLNLQIGGQGLGPAGVYMQKNGFASATNLFIKSGMFNWRSAYWNGSVESGLQTDSQVTYVDPSGISIWTLFAASNLAFGPSDPSDVPHMFDSISGIGNKSYGANIIDRTSSTTASGATNNVTLGMAWQDFYLSGPLTINITNIPPLALTNVLLGSGNGVIANYFFYPGLASQTITFTNDPRINLNWESDSGTQIAPTNVPSGKRLHVILMAAITGGVTNVIANYKIGSFTPFIDTDAQAFFNAVGAGGMSATESNAINTLVIAEKADGNWALNDVIYPFIGGTTNSMSYNLKNPATFRLKFTGSYTTNLNGITGDGSTAYIDTGFNIQTSGTQFISNSCSVSIYNKTAAPIGRFFGSQDGSFHYIQMGTNNSSSMIGRITSGTDLSLGSLATFAGFWTLTRTSGTPLLYSPATVTSTSGDNTIFSPSKNIYLLGRNSNGTPDSFSTATLNYTSIGGYKTAVMQAAESADVLAFEIILGRQ